MAVILSFPSFTFPTTSLHRRLCVCALKTGPDGYGSDLLRKPIISPDTETDMDRDLAGISEKDEDSEGKTDYEDDDDDEKWVDWEDRILEDTVPLVGFVRMILHSGKYQSGDRLSPEHERTVVERLLPFHPEFEKKIGSGINYITAKPHMLPDLAAKRMALDFQCANNSNSRSQGLCTRSGARSQGLCHLNWK
uniref:Uncharacterized protein n=1 Tax=Fagus sylvatica TaxID=28930 RepID=A0A2N9FZ34_FAGSY